MFRMVAPAGSPVSTTTLIGAMVSRGKREKTKAALTEKLVKLIGAQKFFFTNSGRTGLTMILKAMQTTTRSERNVVILPAYTCYSVAAAVIRAGLKIRLVDLSPESFNYDYGQLKEEISSDTLAVLGCGLFGLLPDMRQLRTIADSAGAFLIDDAAQSMGSKTADGFSGTLGDAGFFSLDRGKNMTAYAGGIVMTKHKELAAQMKIESEQLKPVNFKDEFATILKLGIYSLLLHPRCYWLPSSLPFLGLGETEFDSNFSMSQLSQFQLSVATRLIDKLEKHNRLRAINAKELAEQLSGNSKFNIAGFNRMQSITYLRLPLIFNENDLRDRGLVALKKIGISASTMYPEVISKIPGIESHLNGKIIDFPGAQKIVDSLLALPTQPYLTQADIKRTVNTLTTL